MSQLNFKKLEAYPVDIESFDHDVSDMVNSIYVGPQGELLEKIDDFNNRFETNIEVTKSFTLKPGGYDLIKEAYGRWALRYDLKPRGISSIFKRISDYSWRSNTFKTPLLAIERSMQELKRSGLRWQDNTDDFVQEFDKFKENIIAGVQTAKELYPDVEVSVKIVPTSSNRLSDSSRQRRYVGRQVFPEIIDTITSTTDFIVTFYIHLKNIVMTTHILNDREAIETYDTSCGDVVVISGSYLLPMISRNWGREISRVDRASANQYSYFLEAIYLDNMGLNKHPYIGSAVDRYAWDLNADTFSGNLCTGNMGDDLRDSMINTQVEAHITHVVTWLTNYYVPQTNPLHNVKYLRSIGKNKLHTSYADSINNGSTFVRSMEDWTSCDLSTYLSGSLFQYACNDQHSYYGRHRDEYISPHTEEYISRISDYLNRIELTDMPCQECEFYGDCEISQIIYMLLQKNVLTPEEEGYVGMFIEWNEWDVYRNGARQIHFMEETVSIAWSYKMVEQYDRLLMANQCAERWSLANGEPVGVVMRGNSERYRRRMRCLMDMPHTSLKLLHNNELNEDSIFIWTLDSVTEYKGISGKVRLQGIADEDEFRDSEAVEEWLHQNDEEAIRTVASEEWNNMTPEQRTIHWATRQGGATNL